MTELEELLSQYDYPLQIKQIAEKPSSPRDSSKLLVYDRKDGSTEFDTYANLAEYLPKNALLVFNETKVVPARLIGRVVTGGKVEFLCTKFDGSEVLALSERGLSPGEEVYITKKLSVTVIEKMGKEYRLKIPRGIDIRTLLRKRGITTLPPYLKRSPLTERERRQKYQTVFAKREGSIAAPTASLHFTKRLFKKLKKAGFDTAFITLHVNLGTFMPLTDEAIITGQLHEELYEIPGHALKKIIDAKKHGRAVIPVGTTALRALESAYADKRIRPSGTTRLFIRKGYRFKIADGLITNFHVPKSSLMMLVAALVGRKKLLELYAIAQEKGFRLLSFGDGMLIR